MSNFYNNNPRRNTFRLTERIKKKPYQTLIVFILIFLFLYVFGPFGEKKSNNNNNNHSVLRTSSFTESLYTKFQTETFAYRANGDLKKYDISIITQFTVDRFDRIAMMADKWRAPISAAVYITSFKDIDEVFKLVRNSFAVTEFVDLHFLFANKTRYPVNNLRNLALRNARTEWCLLLDVDFISPLGMYDYLHSTLEKLDTSNNNNNNNNNDNNNNDNNDNGNNNNNNNEKNLKKKQEDLKIDSNDFEGDLKAIEKLKRNGEKLYVKNLKKVLDGSENNLGKNINFKNNNNNENNNNNNKDGGGGGGGDYLNSDNSNINNNNKIAFVIPSFSSSISRFDFPDNKKDLLDFIKQDLIKEINSGVCPKCHGPTNYSRWYLSSEPYLVQYKWIYEPFLLYNRSQIHDYDERLKGYGFDKNSHTFGMAAAGFDFVVLPDAWIIHMNHVSKPWEGADTFNEQMFDCLSIVCESILPDAKSKNGYDPNAKLFNEPLKNNDNCLTREHW
ncbi:hypothetical protein ACTFIR_007408 [Dictyostelium discoideum]